MDDHDQLPEQRALTANEQRLVDRSSYGYVKLDGDGARYCRVHAVRFSQHGVYQMLVDGEVVRAGGNCLWCVASTLVNPPRPPSVAKEQPHWQQRGDRLWCDEHARSFSVDAMCGRCAREEAQLAELDLEEHAS